MELSGRYTAVEKVSSTFRIGGWVDSIIGLAAV
jgi:hypothetical protein